MITFLPTLLGAFLGVSLPIVIRAFIDKRNFLKAIDTVFVQYETYSQRIKFASARVMEEANRSWRTFQQDCRHVLEMNFPSVVDCTDMVLSQYSKYLSVSSVFHLIQDKQNTAITLKTLIESKYQNASEIQPVLNTFIEFTIRRTWTLFSIAKKDDLAFSMEKYNSLIMEIQKMRNKRMTAVGNNAFFRTKVD